MDVLFMFRWKCLRNDDEHIVASYDKERIKLFLMQHGFDPNIQRIDITTNDGIDESDMLEEYTYGTRKRDHLYKIITTPRIVTTVVNEVGNDLSEAMTLGVCALRGEIEIFDRIAHLIDELDFVYILDGIKADTEYDLYDSEEYVNGYPYYESFARDRDTSTLFDQLHDESFHKKSVQPITLETYVSIFTLHFYAGIERSCS